jgi:hypothetical protein
MYKQCSSPVNFRGTTRALSADCGWSGGPTIGFGLLWWRYVKVPDKTDDHMCILLWTFVCGYIYIYTYSQPFFGQLRNRPKSSHPKVTPTSRFQKTTIIQSHSNLYLFIYIYIIYLFIYLSIYLFIYSWLLLLATLQIIAHTYPQIWSPGDDSAQTRQGATWLSRASPYPSWRHLWRGWFLHCWRLASTWLRRVMMCPRMGDSSTQRW